MNGADDVVAVDPLPVSCPTLWTVVVVGQYGVAVVVSQMWKATVPVGAPSVELPVTVAVSVHAWPSVVLEGAWTVVEMLDRDFPVTLKFLDLAHVFPVTPGGGRFGLGVDGTGQATIWYSPPLFVVLANGASWSSASVLSKAWVVLATGEKTPPGEMWNSRCVHVPPVWYEAL